MSHPDLDYMIMMERRREELAAAAHSRLVKEAKNAKKSQAREKQPAIRDRLGEIFTLLLAHVLTFIGERMLAWSCRLQYRRALLLAARAGKQPNPCT